MLWLWSLKLPLLCDLVSHRKKPEHFCCAECFPQLHGLYLSCLNSIKAPLHNQWRNIGASRQGTRSCLEPGNRKLYVHELKWNSSCWNITSSCLLFFLYLFNCLSICSIVEDRWFVPWFTVSSSCFSGQRLFCQSSLLLDCWFQNFLSSYCHLLKFQAGHLQSLLLTWLWFNPIPHSRARISIPVCADNHGNKYGLNGTP